MFRMGGGGGGGDERGAGISDRKSHTALLRPKKIYKHHAHRTPPHFLSDLSLAERSSSSCALFEGDRRSTRSSRRHLDVRTSSPAGAASDSRRDQPTSYPAGTASDSRRHQPKGDVEVGASIEALLEGGGALGRRAIGLHSSNAATARTGLIIPYLKVPRGSGLRTPRGASIDCVAVSRSPSFFCPPGVDDFIIGYYYTL